MTGIAVPIVMFIVAGATTVGLPIARALGRKMDRESGRGPAVPPVAPDPNLTKVFVDSGPPEWVGMVAIAFFIMIAVIVVGFPLARAWARRMERGAAPRQIPPDLGDRLDRIEQAVEAMSVEIERIGEGQRFLTQTMQGLRLPAGEAPAQPLALGGRVPAGEERR